MGEVSFSCEKRQHKEADKCPEHPCWCWLENHTYEFSQEVIPLSLMGWLKGGPRERSTVHIQIQISRDGVNYKTIDTKKVSCKNRTFYTVTPDKFANKKLKFIRFHAIDGFVDYSSGTLGYTIPCKEGETKCVGYDLYKCINGVWQLVERNSPQCGFQPECLEGDLKCVGYDLYMCMDGRWQLIETNSERCGYVPPECQEGETKCVGYDLYECIDGKWQLIERNSEQCGYQPPSPPPTPPPIPPVEIPIWAILLAAGAGLIGMYLVFGGRKT